MTRKRYNVRLRLAATVVAAVLSLSGCTFQEMDRMSRKAQASGDIAREHVSEQMRSSQGVLVWTDKPWVNLKPVPTVSRDTPLENFPDCQITLARDGLTLPEIGERITALCGVRVIFSPDALAVGQSSGTTRALNGPLPTPDNNGRIPLDQLGGAVDRAGVTATPLVLSGLRWQGKLSGLLDMIAARTGLTPRMDNGAILFSLLETRTFQFTFLNTNITSNASVTSGSTSSMGTSGGTTNSSVSGDSSSSQQTTVDQSRNVYDDMKKTLETMLTPQKGRFWLSASTGTLTVTDTGFLLQPACRRKRNGLTVFLCCRLRWHRKARARRTTTGLMTRMITWWRCRGLRVVGRTIRIYRGLSACLTRRHRMRIAGRSSVILSIWQLARCITRFTGMRHLKRTIGNGLHATLRRMRTTCPACWRR